MADPQYEIARPDLWAPEVLKIMNGESVGSPGIVPRHDYVVGFCFDSTGESVLLIEKNRPMVAG